MGYGCRTKAAVLGALLVVVGSGCEANPEPIAVLVTPTYATLAPGGIQALSATVAFDATNHGVRWELAGCTGDATVCGTLSDVTPSSATYTAPAARSYVAVYITARAVADDIRSSTATVVVGSPRCARC